MKVLRLTVLLLGGSCLAIASTSSARAIEDTEGQPARVDTEAEPTASDRIGDIVVTAQRRSESAQDVPIAITALSAENLVNAGVTASTQVAAQIPNVTVNTTYVGSAPRFFVRGVGLGDFNATATGSVGIYADDVFLASPNLLTFQLYDIERVEVLRGPQGTLYGRNTTGGAIRFEPVKPDGTFEGFASARYGRFDEIRLEGGLSVPIAPDFGVRLSGLYTSRDGTFFNRFTGRNENRNEAWAARAVFAGMLTDRLDVSLNVHGGVATPDTTRFQHRGILDPATGTPCDLTAYRAFACVDALGYRDSDGDLFAGSVNRAGPERVESFGANLQLSQDFGFATLTSITAYEWVERVAAEDVDASPNNLVDAVWRQPSEQFSQELRLASNESEGLRWLVGAFYLHDDRAAANRFRVLPDLPVPSSFEALQEYALKTEAFAIFGETQVDLTDTISAIAGLRWTTESSDYSDRVTFEAAGGVPVPGGLRLLDFAGNTASDELTWRLGLNYQPNNDVLVYLSYNRGYRAGGFNGGFAVDPVQKAPFAPETIDAYEIGMKADFSREVRLNLSAFYYDYRDLQVFTLRQSGGVPAQVLENAANAEIYGAEAELTLAPVRGLTINSGLGLLHTEAKEYTTLDPSTLQPIDLSGNRLRSAPEVTFNINAEYVLPLTNTWDLSIYADARYQSDIFFDANNNPRLTQSDYWISNARIAVGPSDGAYQIAFYAQNVFDEVYFREIANLGDFGLDELAMGDPVTYGVELRFRF